MTRDPTWGTGCYRGVPLIKSAGPAINDLLTITLLAGVMT